VQFHFFHPIEVRYADIDAQHHVNSARYFTYMEQARAAYIQSLGLWSGGDFSAIGIIIAEQSCSYKSPIHYRQAIEVGVRTSRIGTKSMVMDYLIRDGDDQHEMASGQTVLVAYDYRTEQSVAVPQTWRDRILEYEGDQ